MLLDRIVCFHHQAPRALPSSQLVSLRLVDKDSVTPQLWSRGRRWRWGRPIL
jgi:hypothetical protein